MIKKTDRKKIFIAGLLILVLAAGFFAGNIAGRRAGRGHVISESAEIKVKIGQTDISEYVIVCEGNGSREAAKKLQSYILHITGNNIRIGSSKGSAHTITIKRTADRAPRILIENGNVVISGTSSQDCLESVYVFANEYLGWAFAGQDREHILKGADYVNIPENSASDYKDAWMEEREPIICLWDTDKPRGQYGNINASLASELMSYSDDMLYTYIRMMKYMGYSGIQVTDMCSTWAAYGNYEFVHQRIRFMADAAHSLDMNFTLWVWGAEFTGYGWQDTSVSYGCGLEEVRDCPEAIASCEKYYDIYSELADCSDRIVAHYDDPSNIHKSEDVAFFAKMLMDKCRAINPEIKFAVSDYTDKFDKSIIKDVMGNDVMIMYGANVYNDDAWNWPREFARDFNVELGIWSWNLTGMEIDQLATMNVNADIIKEVYCNTRKLDEIQKPTYWSEMESYHLLNIFSHYCAGRLLINPDESSQELLKDIAQAVVGNERAEDFYGILCLIQDARSGHTFSQFRYTISSSDYLLTSEEYNAEYILAECEKYMPVLDELINAQLKENTIPLPVSVSELLTLMKSHIQQIYEFAVFRSGLDEIEAAYEKGESSGKLQKKIDELYDPISNYDCVVGVWGNAEALAQYKLTESFCNKAGLEVPKDPVFTFYREQYIYQEMIAYQKESNGRRMFDENASFIWGAVIGDEAAWEIVDSLVEQGLLSREADGRVYLTDWEDYLFVRQGK